jgi:hypothetical protein
MHAFQGTNPGGLEVAPGQRPLLRAKNTGAGLSVQHTLSVSAYQYEESEYTSFVSCCFGLKPLFEI